ncbi:hypothetical protein T265_04833 [Opisthorchis viverrini]|uniref:Uncharacterized protein n=1 Tax=Opisthorchis viverrini TaxID=6198 RepID=A0A074ZR61_OPIVI|nr:hypothetical protein T265_04833 [Opisthorchis viverrini]KER28302.1 hypothetical protein T265_04833 [Opisthorchis viverrini]
MEVDSAGGIQEQVNDGAPYLGRTKKHALFCLKVQREELVSSSKERQETEEMSISLLNVGTTVKSMGKDVSQNKRPSDPKMSNIL